MNEVKLVREFISIPSFIAKWEKLGLNDEDMRRLEYELLNNPKLGNVITGTGGIRKVRFAFRNRGKSGSIRIIYIDFEIYEKIYFVDVYQKNDKDNLTGAEKNQLKDLVELIELGEIKLHNKMGEK